MNSTYNDMDKNTCPLNEQVFGVLYNFISDYVPLRDSGFSRQDLKGH